MTYRSGDFWRICDRSGRKVRASQTAKQWDGLIVSLAEFEERHPQDFVRGRKDHQSVPDPRPEGVDSFLGPLTTTTTSGGRERAGGDGHDAVGAVVVLLLWVVVVVVVVVVMLLLLLFPEVDEWRGVSQSVASVVLWVCRGA